MMKIVIIAATDGELVLLKQKINSIVYDKTQFNITFYVTGIGILASCFSITKLLIEQQPQLVIQVGIAGSYNKEITLASVFAVQDETVADAGVYESNVFKDLFDLQLILPDNAPYCNKRLVNKSIGDLNITQLKLASGITVNEICTNENTIQNRLKNSALTLESMEGASLHYCCLQTTTPFMQIRAVSNIVGERNKVNWQIENALEKLTEEISNYLQQLFTQQQSFI